MTGMWRQWPWWRRWRRRWWWWMRAAPPLPPFRFPFHFPRYSTRYLRSRLHHFHVVVLHLCRHMGGSWVRKMGDHKVLQPEDLHVIVPQLRHGGCSPYPFPPRPHTAAAAPPAIDIVPMQPLRAPPPSKGTRYRHRSLRLRLCMRNSRSNRAVTSVSTVVVVLASVSGSVHLHVLLNVVQQRVPVEELGHAQQLPHLSLPLCLSGSGSGAGTCLVCSSMPSTASTVRTDSIGSTRHLAQGGKPPRRQRRQVRVWELREAKRGLNEEGGAELRVSSATLKQTPVGSRAVPGIPRAVVGTPRRIVAKRVLCDAGHRPGALHAAAPR